LDLGYKTKGFYKVNSWIQYYYNIIRPKALAAGANRYLLGKMDDDPNEIEIQCIKVDLRSAERARLGPVIVELLDSYAQDIFGGLEPLSDYTRDNLIEELSRLSTAHVFLAKAGSDYCGITICFEGFSTFACKPLINIHDMYVRPQFRGKGVSSALLFAVGK
jgi:GNAT superfamily N-acetyltransferase